VLPHYHHYDHTRDHNHDHRVHDHRNYHDARPCATTGPDV
jgi:hypothetical protein